MEDYAQIYGKRLAKLMEEHGLSQTDLSYRLDTITNSALSTYVLGKRTPRIETLVEICDYFDVSLDYMFGRSECRKPVNQAVVEMPILKSYYNGVDNFQDSNIEDRIPVAKSRFADVNNLFGYTIKSSLMRPRFYEGDIVIVERTKDVKTGDIVLVAIGSDNAYVRELTTTNGGWVLNPFSPVKCPTFYSWEDMEKQNVRLIGKVIESLVKY